MTTPFSPAWWLPDPHTMTLWPRYFRRRPPVATTTETWDTPDGDQVDVVRLAGPAGAPRVLLLHGLEGSLRSHYAQGLLHQAAQRHWGADLLIFRTCNGRINRVPRSYHSGETTDLDFIVRRVIEQHPRSRMAIVGVSLGGNVVLKWLGEHGDGVPAAISAAAAVSTPFDLARSSRHISRGFARVYERHFLASLRVKALAKIERFPEIASRQAVLAARTLWEFDDAFTSVVHGFRDAADYYERSSSIRFLGAIRRPTLLLSARDDPFHPPQVLDEVAQLAGTNPCLHIDFPERGGHAGFVAGPLPWRARAWGEQRVSDFLAPYLTLE